MNDREAAEFIASAVGEGSGVWADFGAGTGTFTRALRALLGPGSRIYAVDHNPAAVAALRTIGDDVVAIRADLSMPITLPERSTSPLQGMLFANALHFLPGAEDVLRRHVKLLEPGGRIVIVEYDRRAASRWVPYPIPSSRWPDLASAAGLADARVTARRKSRYAGELYAAVAVTQ